MTPSSFAETEAVPLRNGGYEADSTSNSGLRSAEEREETAVVDADGRRETLPCLPSRSFSTSSSSSSSHSSNRPWRPRSSTEVYTCHLCSFVGVARESFDQHMVDCHYIYRCMECSYSARTQGRLKRHLKDTHHRSGTIGGHREGPGRPSPQQRPTIGDQLQVKMNRRLKTIRCKYCKFITVQKTDFWLHLSEHIPPDKQLRCTRCPFVTDLKHHHEYHQRSHDGFKPFLCQKCGYSCVNKSMLNSHSKSHSNVYRFRCGVCSFAAKYSHALKLHVLKYGHCAGPVLNQDGSLPVPVNVAMQQPPTANPVFHQDGAVGGRQISGPSEGTLLHQDGRFSSKGMTGCSEQLRFNHVESVSVQMMPALVETEVPLRRCEVSAPTCSRIPVFHLDGEDDSVPVTFGLSGRDAFHDPDGNLSMSANSGLALRRRSTENDTSLSFGYANGRREEVNDHAALSTAVIDQWCSKEPRKERESQIEVGKKKVVDGGPMLDLPFNSVRVRFPSQTVPPSLQFAPVDLRRPAESAVNLTALLQRKRRVIPPFPSFPYPAEFGGGSELGRFHPPATVVSENITAASSTPGRPFQINDGYSTSTLLSSENQESGMNCEEEPLSLPGSNGETDTAEIGEFIMVDDTRWDNVELERPLDLSKWKRPTVVREQTLTQPSWNDVHVQMTLPSALPPHQTSFTTTTFLPSSTSTPPTPYHLRQTVPSFHQQPASRPPPLLPLSWTHHRNETRHHDRFQLNDKDEVLTSQDSDHQGNHHPVYPPFPDDDVIDCSPVKLEWREEDSDPSAVEGGRDFECRHCRMIFHDYVMFAIHSDHHGYVDPFECSRCGERCADRIEFFLHISRVAHD